MTRSQLLSIALFAAGGLLAGCAQEIGDIDRTQPNGIEKAAFDGEWYFNQTVVDTNGSAVTTFGGETGMYIPRIRFEITEDYLIGYRNFEDYPGLDTEAGPDIVIPDSEWNSEFGQPVLAIPISSHFDIQRGYNASTGEQTNVISENGSDRPWFEREFLRATWGRNDVHPAIDWMIPIVSSASLGTQAQNEGPDVTFFVERDEEGQVDYIDIVNTWIIEPDWLSCVLMFGFPAYGGDCGPETITVRTSLARIPENQDFIPREYSDYDMNRFGFFRNERTTFDPRFGDRDSGRVSTATIHDIWDNQLDANGVPTPESTWIPRPIAYYLNADAPTDVYDEMARIAEEYSYAFQRVVMGVQDKTADEIGTMFYICANPGGTTEDPRRPDWATEEMDAFFDQSEQAYDRGVCVRPGDVKNVGDVRYNMVVMWNTYQVASPLGYGPPAADVTSGQIIQGTANVYMGGMNTYAQQIVDMVHVINNDMTPEDLGRGEYIEDYFAHLREEANDDLYFGRDRRMEISTGPVEWTPAMREIQRASQDYAETMRVGREVLNQPRTRAILGQPLSRFGVRSDFDSNPLAVLEGTALEREAIFPEFKEHFSMGQLGATDEIPDEMMEYVSPFRMGTLQAFRSRYENRRRDLRERTFCLFQDELDYTLLGVAEEYAQYASELRASGEYDEFEVDEMLWSRARNQILMEVATHEIGHTVGLRHNPGASSDALNFHPGYWALREQTFNEDCSDAGWSTFAWDGLHTGEVAPSRCDSSETREAYLARSAQVMRNLDAGILGDDHSYHGIATYALNSVMEYPVIAGDFLALGLYDYAALAYGYGELIEVFNHPPHRVNVTSVWNATDGTFDSGNSVMTRSNETVERMDDVENYVIRRAGGTSGDQPDDGVRDHEWDYWHYSILPMMFGNVAEPPAGGEPDRSEPGMHYPPSVRFEGVNQMWAMYDRSLMPLDEAEAAGAVEVPYYFCSDEYAGSTSRCQYFDTGADQYEILKYVRYQYEHGYVLDFFRRDRAGWGLDLLPILNRLIDRSMMRALQRYQFFLINAISRGEDWYNQPYGGLDSYNAAVDGVNFLGRIITTPSPGTYARNIDSGIWENVSEDMDFRYAQTDPQGEGLDDEDYFSLGIEDGARFASSQFRSNRFGENGYYYFLEYSILSHFWAKFAALMTLVNGDVEVLGADTDSNLTSFYIPPYLIFPDHMQNFFSSVILEDVTDIGRCRGEDGSLSPIDIIRSDAAAACDTGDFVNPYAASYGNSDFNTRFLSTIYAAAFFQNNFDRAWVDEAGVYVLGRGETPELPPVSVDGGAEVDYYWHTYTDEYGVTYGAICPTDWDPADVAPTHVRAGCEMIESLISEQLTLDEIAVDAFESSEWWDQYYNLQGQVDMVRLLSRVNNLYGEIDAEAMYGWTDPF